MSEGMSGGTYPNRKWVEVEGGQEDREISGEAMATILRLTQAHTEAVRVAAEYQERAEAYARLIDRLVTELDAWKASPDSLSHRAHWIHPDDHAALAAELERVTAALREARHLLGAVVNAERIDRLPGDHAVNVALLSVDEFLADAQACECDAPRCERDGCQDKPTPGGARAAHTQPCDCVWCRFQRDPAVVVTDAMVKAGTTAYTYPVGDEAKARAHVRAILEAALAGGARAAQEDK
jgi:hypothetical protein